MFNLIRNAISLSNLQKKKRDFTYKLMQTKFKKLLNQ